MRCSSCNAQVPGKKVKESGGRCTSCGHAFVANQRKDGVSDFAIKKAVEKVSGGGKVLYFTRHVVYELLRRLARRRQGRFPLLACAAAVLVAAAALAVKYSIVILVPGVVIGAILAARALNLGRHSDLFALMARYEKINPPQAPVPSIAALAERERARDLAGLRAAPRLLVCEHVRQASFLIANDFHLHHACPVAGPDGAGMDGFPELKHRLARPGKLDLFTLHDRTPAGAAFARRIAAMPEVRGRREPATLIDMGLGEAHAPALAEAGTEIEVLRPSLLLAAAGRSIAERAPMRLGKGKDEDDEDIHGDDSE